MPRNLADLYMSRRCDDVAASGDHAYRMTAAATAAEQERFRLPSFPVRAQPRGRLFSARALLVAGKLRARFDTSQSGTGKEVVDESIADAKTPLQISWFGGSYLDLPVRR